MSKRNKVRVSGKRKEVPLDTVLQRAAQSTFFLAVEGSLEVTAPWLRGTDEGQSEKKRHVEESQ